MKDYPLKYGDTVWKLLEKNMKRGEDRSVIFSDFLELMLNTFLSYSYNFKQYSLEEFRKRMNANNLSGPYEKRYKDIIKKYNKQEANNFAKAMGELINEMTENKVDILGYLFESRITYGDNGQFFTPEDIAKLMNTIVDSDSKDEDKLKDVIDPACGSGRFLIERGLVKKNSVLHGVDLDRRCSIMSVLNMFLFGFNSVITHGNSLSLETYTVWKTIKTCGIMLMFEYKGKDKQ